MSNGIFLRVRILNLEVCFKMMKKGHPVTGGLSAPKRIYLCVKTNYKPNLNTTMSESA